MATNKQSIMVTFHSGTATELANQIDNAGSRSAAKLMSQGLSVALANEIIAQATAKTGTATKLMALGVPVAQATALATALNSAA